MRGRPPLISCLNPPSTLSTNHYISSPASQGKLASEGRTSRSLSYLGVYLFDKDISAFDYLKLIQGILQIIHRHQVSNVLPLLTLLENTTLQFKQVLTVRFGENLTKIVVLSTKM